MEFRESKPIYLQIVDFIFEKILVDEWKADERIPSVRELAVALAVNPNTIMRSYEYLQEQKVIYNQRGIGYFVSANAQTVVLKIKRNDFMQNGVEALFKDMLLLGISIDEVKTLFNQYKKKYQTIK